MPDLNLTASQLLFWSGQKLHNRSPIYNIVSAVTIFEPIEIEGLRRAFQTLVNSSDALRGAIDESSSTPRMRVVPSAPYRIEYFDFSHQLDRHARLDSWIRERSRRAFDLNDRLYDSALIKFSDREYVYYLNHHQLIGDGWASVLMLRHLFEFYELSLKGELPDVVALPQFADYVGFERQHRSSPRYAKTLSYWKQKLAERLAPMTFYGRQPQRQTVRGNRIGCGLNPARRRKLNQLASQRSLFKGTPDLSLFILYASIFFRYLQRISGATTLSLGVMNHNRVSKTFGETIGMLMGVVPLRVKIEEGESALSFYHRVSDEVLQSLKYGQHSEGNPVNNRTYYATLNYIASAVPEFRGRPINVDWVHPGAQTEVIGLNIRQSSSQGEVVLEFDFDSDFFTAEQQLQAIEDFCTTFDEFLDELGRAIASPGVGSLVSQ
ncbi:MAG TPA: condensation domain-containing protein [Blastocatellia bacterium]|nr:condensation domain-containing protein [Blastocatellia bacterium]